MDNITVGDHKLSDERMILNQNESVNLLFNLIENNKLNISKKILCKLHDKVSYNEALKFGGFRGRNIRVGGTEYIPSDWKKLEKINHIVKKAILYFLLNAK